MTFYLDTRTAKFLTDLSPNDLAPVVMRPGITLSRFMAAALCRRSPAVIARAVAEGTLPASYRGSHPYLAPQALARWAGHADFTPNDYSAAMWRLAGKEPTSERPPSRSITPAPPAAGLPLPASRSGLRSRRALEAPTGAAQ